MIAKKHDIRESIIRQLIAVSCNRIFSLLHYWECSGSLRFSYKIISWYNDKQR